MLSKAPCPISKEELELYHLTIVGDINNNDVVDGGDKDATADDSSGDLIVKC